MFKIFNSSLNIAVDFENKTVVCGLHIEVIQVNNFN